MGCGGGAGLDGFEDVTRLKSPPGEEDAVSEAQDCDALLLEDVPVDVLVSDAGFWFGESADSAAPFQGAGVILELLNKSGNLVTL